MGRHHATADYEDDEDDEVDDVDAPDARDRDDSDEDEPDTVTCPKCGRDVSELAEQCPRCGTYLSQEDSPRTNFPAWVIVTAVVLLAAIAFGWLGGAF
jgi:uncharacterized paraquat-inducible protein A